MFGVRDTMPDAEVSLPRSEGRAPIDWGSGAMVCPHGPEVWRLSLIIKLWLSNLHIAACIAWS